MKALWLLSTALVAAPLYAQDTATPQAAPAAPAATPESSSAAQGAVAGGTAPAENPGEIVVTATRRASPLSDVPVAVSAITADTLQNTGATDIRQLNQVAPSLYVSSTSSEAGAGGARIRGIGTVGDNAGLESSVATFIDGVYRSRAGVALTELGPVERIEVLRGPQGTLFGRNASAGLINVVTARPRFEEEAYAEASYGNYDYYRLGAGLTGPIGEKIAYRLDGIYAKRDGFIRDVISGRDINDRDRYLVRGKLLFQPSETLSVLVTGDFANRKEECCVGPYLATKDVSGTGNGTFNQASSSIAALIRGINSAVPGAGRGQVLDDTFARRVAITPGRDYTQDVRDWGLAAEVNAELGDTATLTSITAYRDFNYLRGQDADFNNLDILARPGNGYGFQRFRTFSQEVRLQGSTPNAFLDWLVGGYYANEKLAVNDNIEYGADYEAFAAGRARLLAPAFGALAPAFAGFPGFGALNPFTGAVLNALLPAATPGRAAIIAGVQSLVVNTPLNGQGARDRFRQDGNNYALFTHNIVNFSDRLSLTLGARYTWDRKDLDANLFSSSSCNAYVGNINRLEAFARANPALAAGIGGYAGVLRALAGLPCVINSQNLNGSSKKKESEWSGTAVLSYKPTDRLLTYASYSRGYKAGGFNLDRAPLFDPRAASLASTGNLDVLKFQPEKVDAYELGAKFDGRRIDVNVAAFYQMFKSFQLNTFNGTNFFVTDIRGCKDDLGTTDEDLIFGNSNCANTRSGVVSKGVEVEAFLYPAPNVTFALGYTLADTKYRKNLAGTPDFFVPANGNSLVPATFLLPGQRVSNAALHTVTGATTFTPPITDSLRGLLYVDFRYQSEFNTGSDLFPEKEQNGVMLINARVGVGADDKRWSLEFWAQNLTNIDFRQVAFNSPIQGSNTSLAQTQRFGGGPPTSGTQLFSSFLGEPRTYGVTVRTKF